MINVEIDPSVFNPVYYPLLNDLRRTQIIFGGSGSGKSVFQAQRTIYDLLQGGRNYLICRAVQKSIRRSVFNEINKVISSWGLSELFNINKTEQIITCKNGYQIYFSGLDDLEKIKSITPEKGVITDIWIEEATETNAKAAKELYKRQRGGDEETPKRMIFTFNPIYKSHWIYKTFFSGLAWADDQTEFSDDKLRILKTWHIHNEFLTQADHSDLENESDPYYYNVYTLGNWGVLGNIIFNNWTVQDLSGYEDLYTDRRNGLDFGFSSDPAALSCSHYDRKKKTIYIFDELYERGLTNDVLAAFILPLIGKDAVICDSSEPKSIEELRRHGVNARAAEKGKDSVLFGIQWLQQQKIIIHKDCINTRNEFELYKWKEDKDGNAIRQPVDKYNHLIDAIRYAYERDSGRSLKIKTYKVDLHHPQKKLKKIQGGYRSEEEIEDLLERQIA